MFVAVPERTELAKKYIEQRKGTQTEDFLKKIVGIEEPPTLEYLLGAEKMTIKAITQLQELSASPTIMLVWSQILAYLSFEIEQQEVFKGNE